MSISEATPPLLEAVEGDEHVVVVDRLVKSFGDHEVLRGVDLTIGRDEFVALLGRSGGGKSTLLRLLEGLDTDYSGGIRVPPRRSVVFQEPRLLPWRRVWQNVVLGLDGSRRALREQALQVLAEVGLERLADSWPATLSGGEAQRVGLARALVREPDLLLLDEPFGALDALTKIRSHALLRELVRVHRPGVFLITHDVDEAIALADRIIVLEAGRFIIDTPVPRADADDGSRARLDATRREILAALGVEDPLRAG
ncbi:ABC transporter ATP-binding protein [Leucobacter weissii]|uniref:ABC transporter ATP-binding protein n=1 Tax=Leucobacter weissii TaxID=1983706 RepID=A0A939MNN3_9MICO|nr:ABC transporter ATP-binding protein [Leucobacter weissii]MBO1901776.1 ABC transporter ATP-binding protein [Leucobacter weissii]